MFAERWAWEMHKVVVARRWGEVGVWYVLCSHMWRLGDFTGRWGLRGGNRCGDRELQRVLGAGRCTVRLWLGVEAWEEREAVGPGRLGESLGLAVAVIGGDLVVRTEVWSEVVLCVATSFGGWSVWRWGLRGGARDVCWEVSIEFGDAWSRKWWEVKDSEGFGGCELISYVGDGRFTENWGLGDAAC